MTKNSQNKTLSKKEKNNLLEIVNNEISLTNELGKLTYNKEITERAIKNSFEIDFKNLSEKLDKNNQEKEKVLKLLKKKYGDNTFNLITGEIIPN